MIVGKARLAFSALLLGAVASIVACSRGPAAPSPPLTGTWGGDHVSLTIAAAGEHLEFDCAHGDIPGPFALDGRSAFNAAGTFVREHGGPIRVDEVLDARPALYTGSVTADAMILTVQLIDTREQIGTFTLIRGAPGRVVKCL
jgi:hypothetical protein